MKIKNYLAMVIVALCAGACSNDNEKSMDLSEAVAGTYTVYTSAKVMGTSMVNNNETVKLTASAGDAKAALFYKGVWGEGRTSDLTVTAAVNGGYTLNGSGSIVASMGDSSHSGTYEFTVKGTISADKKEASFTFVIELGAMGTVTVTSGLGYAPAGEFLTGTYKGYTSTTFVHSPNPIVADGEVMTVTADEDGTVKVVLTSTKWGTTTVDKAKATRAEDGSYTFTGSGTSTVPAMHGGTANNYDCTLTGTVSADKGAVSSVFSIEMGGMGTVVVTFHKGTAPVAG
ncbi:calycin-like domain-containing protein [Bacteroides helcogenes]|uniref:Lipocalin-like domain-containing protein n=1 Tax=Bacteroides helcogenes (strain ATCC 35417 / DSM 20613 / JCM 6297 / CCUG 15421 / P 36-108) TaxID=693979 RepID=E6SRR6_BACT6|nr:calycin-like domain-containing protein [Bacteroides helcogenes]ADV45156.1 hypothetical protein Bache_3232 [Bacteroides helcogenes P 36-108]MDY5238715.1 calycin-like domain-containing protein [Bacteroides helcogenes]